MYMYKERTDGLNLNNWKKPGAKERRREAAAAAAAAVQQRVKRNGG